MNLTPEHLQLLSECVTRLKSGFDALPAPTEPECSSEMAAILQETAGRLQENYPYHHPFYLGQMLKPPHPIAHLAYSLAMCINPNNHAHDGGRASSEMERECIAQLAAMLGWREHLGHLCGGGTMANCEALWIAREMTGGKAVAASAQAHYTHSRLSGVLGVPFVEVPVDACGRMDVSSLESQLQTGSIGTVVATLGTTGLGGVDPLADLVELQAKYGFRLHVDAAYGGYFKLLDDLPEQTLRAFASIGQADSVVIDPHKHGLQPYGCGCVLFRDPRVAAIYRHESPYTYFTSDDLHLGEISLECSRPGAAAAALWATLRLFPLQAEGHFAGGLAQGRQAALALQDWVKRTPGLAAVNEPELDIAVWMVAAPSATQSSALARRIFEEAAQRNIHLALMTLPRSFLQQRGAVQNWDADQVICLRACLMKPEHLEWMPQIISRLEESVRAVLA